MNQDTLGVSEYFETLKKEYVITWVRLETCCTEREKRYFTKVLSGKKDKLKKIASQYKFIDIFSNRVAYEEAFNKNLRTKGAPYFTYRSADERKEMFKKDINNYYSFGSIVKYFPSFHNDDYVIAEVIDFYLPEKVVTLKLSSGTELQVDYRQVTRVFEF